MIAPGLLARPLAGLVIDVIAGLRAVTIEAATMRGKVKWFSREKGYGFITDEKARDHYFSVRDVRGADLPSSGDGVQFQSQDTNRGLRASGIQLVARSVDGHRRDDRVKCRSCGKAMVPRIISYQGEVERSVCPFCAETYCEFLAPSTPRWVWVAVVIFVLVIFVGCWSPECAANSSEEEQAIMHAVVRNVDEITPAWKELEARVSVKLSTIRSEHHYKAMTKLMNELLDEVGDRKSHPLIGLLDVVTMFIRDYEEREVEIPEASPAAVLRFLMDQRGRHSRAR